MIHLRRCPWCRTDKYLTPCLTGKYWNVHCSFCQCFGPETGSEQSAIDDWNSYPCTDDGIMPDGRYVQIPNFSAMPAEITVMLKQNERGHDLWVLEATAGNYYSFKYGFADKEIADFVAEKMEERQQLNLFWGGMP